MEQHFVRSHILYDLKHLTSCIGVCPVFIVTYAAIYIISFT